MLITLIMAILTLVVTSFVVFGIVFWHKGEHQHLARSFLVITLSAFLIFFVILIAFFITSLSQHYFK
ncbi:Uncharacterised protein [Legionella feeleii]|uniref:Uncharacterized protein n=1 Tax=Legionella feeleii TaxID=453 RepID=A0A378IXA3_9GAMM|nr:Uncharacterised protein [Legionella feeleii]